VLPSPLSFLFLSVMMARIITIAIINIIIRVAPRMPAMRLMEGLVGISITGSVTSLWSVTVLEGEEEVLGSSVSPAE